ncbi:hypothetical protein I8D64_08325 [Brachybacterium sp. MASK1Z-5]|uniref:Uncharacterized protein n=1 Tax=Brachybacterium halotolerans TaxID=2795215 RepID=A0ABS1BBN0_9MICO|nr:hypothetical protein [Brachybacterium halotolerans]MBK0331405.1 hypothetical protein [Brachybacterium halotolerans]
MGLLTTLHVELPGWLVDRLEELPAVLPTLEERMDVADELADLTWRSGDGARSPHSWSRRTGPCCPWA